MAATAGGISYAPEDPNLPKPWRGLVDGKTGYIYYWNPETSVTQYERPVPPSQSHLSSEVAQESLNSSVQRSPRQRQDNDSDNGLCSKASNYECAKSASGSENYQDERSRVEYSAAYTDTKRHNEHAPPDAKGVEGCLPAESYCRLHEISVTGDNIPPPFTSFGATGFPPELLREVRNAGFSAPTPIQAQSWPIAMKGRDIVAIAKTGSGKTLGFLIPGFIHLKQRSNNPRLGPTVLVLSPTRELATQIQDEAVKFGKSSSISCTCLYGGAPKGPQLKDLDRGVHIVVATPGRLNDILEMRRISLHQVSYLVLDEADRMLDMGFEPQIRKIVNEVPSRRQTLMFTATWPNQVRRIASDLLNNPVQVNIGNADELVANKSITQHVEVVPQMDKRRRLEQILRSQEPGSKIIIFCSTKKMCDVLASNLSGQFGAVAIHGDKSQGERDHVLNQFRTGRSPILVATDVAARGLDIKDIRVVVNYDFPTGIEDYVHRIGRTGRAGATGLAYTFFGDQDAKHASDLVKILDGANQTVPDQLRDMSSRGAGTYGSRRQWNSGDGGRGGHYDSRGSGGYDREKHDRYGSSSNECTPHTFGAAPYKSFHESMVNSGTTSTPSRSRSRSPPGALGGCPQVIGSRSPNGFDRNASSYKSFHESMMDSA